MSTNNENTQQERSPLTNIFTQGMKKDPNELFIDQGAWSHARNAVNNSHDGQVGVIGNEPANLKLLDFPYTNIGNIHIVKDRWAVFTTDDINSEIGLFEESTNTYVKIVNDPLLAFKKSNLITGVAKENFDCTWSIYWDDASNPSRTLNIDKVPYLPASVSKDDCKVITYTKNLDIEKLRLAPLLTTPSIRLMKGSSGGSLPNGSYQAVVAYTVNQIKVTDYFTPSNVQGLFTHENLSGSLELTVDSMDTNFEEFELVIISVINQQTTAHRIGTYSTHQTSVYIDHIDQKLPVVGLDLIPLQSPAYEKSDSMYEVNNYLIRTGIYTKFDFNYQIQASKIQSKWVAISYPQDYYIKGGNQTSYMRDEQYPFFIKWVYNTGQKSASYHIPGRAAIPSDLTIVTGTDAIETKNGEIPKNWQVYNTATITSLKTTQLPDGGNIIAEGKMGYWESTESYPDNKRNIWGDLCGTKIRHHKFPDNKLVNHHNQGGSQIILLGVKFENITLPLDNNGLPITSIVGYEILRGSREGNKTVIAKGLINNMGEYDIPDGISTRKGLYPNYPYNDLRLDPFLSKKRVTGGCGGTNYTPMGSFRRDVFTFHSPDTGFKNPFLSEYELKIHGELSGNVVGNFDKVFQHPRNKLIRDFALLLAGVIGIGEALFKVKGKKTTTSIGPQAKNDGWIVAGLSTGGTLPALAGGAAAAGFYATGTLLSFIGDVTGLGALSDIFGITKYSDSIKNVAGAALGAVPGVIGGRIDVSKENTSISEIPLLARVLSGLVTFGYYFSQSTDDILKIIKAVSPYQQYGYQYNSHGLYANYIAPVNGNTRRGILKANYLEQHLQDFGDKYRINNLYRPRTVVLQLDNDIKDPSVVDNTRQTIGDKKLFKSPTQQFNTTASAHYASLKVHQPAQYGQLENISQLPISTNVHQAPAVHAKIVSPVLFGGDIYVNRYTEKNTFFYFNDWMSNFPDGFEYDYRLRYNLPYARYWMDSQEYDASQLTNALLSFNFSGDVLPNDLAYLDRDKGDCNSKISFIIKEAYFYLFNNGVRDFYVESEINLAYRDYGESDAQKIYDPNTFTDLPSLFRSDIIKSNNYYKYDFSLSISKLYQNFISWGNILPRYYDPLVAETCYGYYPKRAIYSLPQTQEFLKDNWKVFLVNNYKDFAGRITTIKSVSQNGALIMMQNESPILFNGVDQLQTTGGTKITIGDGGLFSQPLQNISNSERPYQYGSCQNKLSVAATNYGVFYISQDQGKIFNFAGGLDEISKNGNKWWFAKYLPSQLQKQFPDFNLYDNPVIGIGCQSVYDNTNDVLYFMKKDYKCINPNVKYFPETGFGIPQGKRTVIVTPGYTEEIPGSPDCLAPIDIMFVLDTTSSMGSSLNTFKSSISTIATGVAARSNNNYRLGLVTIDEHRINSLPVEDNKVRVPLSEVNNLTNFGQVLNSIQLGDGGWGIPEPSDIAMHSVINSTNIHGVNPGTFRTGAIKMIVLITDAPPGGNTDSSVDTASAYTAANEALSKGIKIYPILTGNGTFDMSLRTLMQNYATVTGGTSYISQDGSVGSAIADAIQNVECPPTIIIHPAITKEVPVNIPVDLSDPIYFEDTSWTISYDPKSKVWISFHDWNPNLVLPGKSHFMTVINNQIWKHNERTDLFCNFYGVDYPWEIEFVVSSGKSVNTVRSIEYGLECFKYSENGTDRFHELDYNFDRAIIYNSEQNTGLLKLNASPKNNPFLKLQYPIVGANGIDILYSKEENKYRFNQFWDATKDRGEFSGKEIQMWDTADNGYNRDLFRNYINYQKSPLQRKKLRHSYHKVFLKRSKSNDIKMLLKLADMKLNTSLR
jgi:hypothetical protein